MRSILAASLFVATTYAQGVTQYIAPPGRTPSGCGDSRPGSYEISVQPLGNRKRAKNDFPPREIGKTLQVTLNKGTMKDNLGRTAYIADNYQFQFDGPPQTGALYTGGWSFCSNGSLALGPSTLFYQCLSGDFYNLYDRWWAEQCRPINLQVHSISDQSTGQSGWGSPRAQGSGALGGSSPNSGVTGFAVASNTLAGGSKATAASSASGSSSNATSSVSGKSTAQTLMASNNSSSSAVAVSTATSTSVVKPASASSTASAGSSSPAAAKSSNVAQALNAKSPAVALLIGALGMAMVY